MKILQFAPLIIAGAGVFLAGTYYWVTQDRSAEFFWESSGFRGLFLMAVGLAGYVSGLVFLLRQISS